MFEIVEVVPDPSTTIKRWWRLKLLCRDDAKGPVSFLCGINGYLVSSMGQKVRLCVWTLMVPSCMQASRRHALTDIRCADLRACLRS